MKKTLRLVVSLGLVLVSSSCASEVVEGARASLTDVTWTNVVGVIVTGASLEKSGVSAWDSGAVSVETLTGDGYIQFTTGEGNRNKMVGLSNGDTDQNYTDIDFAFYLRKGRRISVYEGGVNRGEFGSYIAGDTFRIEVLTGQVRYLHNDVVLYASAVAPTFPLLVDTSFFNNRGTVLDVQIDSSIWTNVVGADATDDDLVKTGATGAWDAGASTLGALTTDGYVEFTTNETNKYKMAGLSNGDTDQTFADIDFAFYMQRGGDLLVYEGGVNRGQYGTYAAGDILRIEAISGEVRYYRNAALLYTSTASATLPLLVDTSMYTNGATIQNVTLREVFWTNDVGVSASGNNLMKPGANGWDAGAVSVSSLVGDGTLTFTSGETNTYKMIGLANGDTDQHFDDIDFAFYLRKSGRVDVYEAGVARGMVGTYSVGDTFRIDVTGTVVTYAIEGATVYTSTVVPTFPLLVDTSLYSSGATLQDVVLTSLGPPDPIDDLGGTVFDRRTGEVDFTWTAVGDANGIPLASYELRCAQAPITDEVEWAAASVAGGVLPTPAAVGGMEAARMTDFRVGTTVNCALRGYDLGGRATPLPASNTSVTVDFLEQIVTAAGSTALGWTVAGIGDVNDDGIADAALGSTGGDVWLYFGSSSGLGATPDVTITGPGSGSGRVITGLGDFNGDNIDDFALSARALNTNSGEVYIMYGRAAASPWPATVDLTSGGCVADVCLTGSESGALFGWSVRSAGDFDGDGDYDIAIGATRAGTEGAIYVILGGTYAANAQFDIPAAMPSLEPDGFSFAAPATWLNLGADSASAGDVFGADGRDDLFVGGTGSSGTGELGRIVSIAGTAYPMAGVGLQTIAMGSVVTLDTGSAGFFGEKLTAGDFDGDGNTDIAVNESRGTGFIFVYRNLGGMTGFDGTRWAITNSIPDSGDDRIGDTLGEAWHPALGVLGDLDGNGAVDVLGGSRERGLGIGTTDLWYFTSPLGFPVDRARANADGVLSPATMSATGRRTAAFIGDVDDDGYPDVAVGDETNAGGAGSVSIYY